MQRLLRLIRRRWFLSILLTATSVPLAYFGFKAWRKQAISNAFEMNIIRIWIEASGEINVEAQCRLNRELLPWWNRIVCPEIIVVDEDWSFGIHADFTPALDREPGMSFDCPETPSELISIRSGVWRQVNYCTWPDKVPSEGRNSGSPITMEIDARMVCSLSLPESRSDDWEMALDKWSDRLDRHRWLPDWLQKSILDIVLRTPERFIFGRQTILLDPCKREFDVISQKPVDANESHRPKLSKTMKIKLVLD